MLTLSPSAARSSSIAVAWSTTAMKSAYDDPGRLACSDASYARHLESLGHTDDASLAQAIRCGDFDDELLRVASVLMPSIRDKVAVANPRWLEPD